MTSTLCYRIWWILIVFSETLNGLSICTPVDSIFIINSEIIIADKDSNNTEQFFGDLVYNASSELSGIGLIVYGQIPSHLTADFTLLGLEETLEKNTRETINIINSHLNFEELGFYDNELYSSQNKVELNHAISTAHQLFLEEGDEYETEALFILNMKNNEHKIAFKKICENVMDTQQNIETLYYLEINDAFEITLLYDCNNNQQIRKYNSLMDLYEITCPSRVEYSETL
eukprot:507738_1